MSRFDKCGLFSISLSPSSFFSLSSESTLEQQAKLPGQNRFRENGECCFRDADSRQIRGERCSNPWRPTGKAALGYWKKAYSGKVSAIGCGCGRYTIRVHACVCVCTRALFFPRCDHEQVSAIMHSAVDSFLANSGDPPHRADSMHKIALFVHNRHS